MNTRKNIIRNPSHCIHILCSTIIVLMVCFIPSSISAQAVTEIITDYNGYWKTASSAASGVRPDNHHNLLSFSFNGTRYSTGVNDALLTSNGETFTAGQYRALPMQQVNGTPSGNTKIGLGAMVDGVYNGAGSAPSRTLGPYLNDGTNGLDLGTCVANLPAGTMFMSVSNLQAGMIGDGIPDILVTQIADPSNSYDAYEFTDVNGNRIGNSLDIVLNNITPVGRWVADFYEATGGIVLQSGFTQTERDIRLWAADFSVFGINASNIGNIAYFKISLSGNSDIAFVAYNAATISVQQVLATGNGGRLTRPDREQEITVMSVYPNPASNVIHFSHPKSSGTASIVLYNAAGAAFRKISTVAGATTTTASVTGLPQGNYFAVYVDGQKKFTQKFLVR